MCGRIALYSEKREILQIAQVSEWNQVWNPKYNIPPTHSLPILFIKDKNKFLQLMHWGFKSAKDLNTINCRSESLNSSPFWTRFKNNTCIVFINGFYEWQADASNTKSKIPYYIHSKSSDSFLALAGVYEIHKSEYSFSILTTSAPSDFIHSRIPILLFDKSDMDAWLHHGTLPCRDIKESINEKLELTRVSSHVNKVGNDGIKCIEYHNESLHPKRGPMDAFVVRKKIKTDDP